MSDIRKNINRKFVVAKEKITDDELETLKDYCQCYYHTMYWFNPVKWFICPCCVGCLQEGSCD